MPHESLLQPPAQEIISTMPWALAVLAVASHENAMQLFGRQVCCSISKTSSGWAIKRALVMVGLVRLDPREPRRQIVRKPFIGNELADKVQITLANSAGNSSSKIIRLRQAGAKMAPRARGHLHLLTQTVL